jgi:excisionase family DNA binding protein
VTALADVALVLPGGDTLPAILTTEQAADLLAVHADTVRRRLEQDRLPHLDRLEGEPWRIKTAELLKELGIPYEVRGAA